MIPGAMKVAISGTTGCGKTTLANSLFRDCGLTLVPEPVPADLLQAFAISPSTNCYALQERILIGRAEYARRCLGADVLVFDRSIGEDVEIFFEMHRRRGYLDERQVQRLSRLAHQTETEVGLPDVFVVLTATRDRLLQRLGHGTHPEAILSSIDEQIQLYADWWNRRTEPRLLIDTTDRSVEAVGSIARWIASSLPRIALQQYPQDKSLDLKWLAGKGSI